MKKLFILDVSGFIFRAYFAIPPMTNDQGEATHALFGFIRSLNKLLKDFHPEHVVAVFDGPSNKKGRQALYPDYKANRTQTYDDLYPQIEQAKMVCSLLGIPCLEIPEVEADDAMGSLAVQAAARGMEIYLCTSDKDLAQLVDDHIFLLNPWKENLIIDRQKVEEIYGVPPEKIVDLLAIMGDSSDNIPGIKGFGPKTAVSLLQEFGSLDNLLANPDLLKGKKREVLIAEKEMALLSRQLATIHKDLPCPLDETFFSLKEADFPKLKAFYLEQNFHSLIAELAPQKEEVLYHLVDTQEELERLMANLERQKEVAFDVETTSLSPLAAELVGIGFCCSEKEAWYVPLNGSLKRERVFSALKTLFNQPNLSLVGHNAKYDAHVLANLEIATPHLRFDTILASYLLNSSGRRHSLDYLALHYFGKVKTAIKELIGSGKKEITFDKVPLPLACNYCCEDVDYTLRVKQVLEKELKERNLLALHDEVELPLSFVLAKMERHGVFLDVPKIEAVATEVKEELLVREQEIYTLAGEEFNINSPKQLAVILFEKLGIPPLKKTATGLSTNADVLEALAKDYPIAEKILAFRSLEKLRSTYLDVLPQEINPKTGRIHPTFNQFIAATGRLACQNPNLQNIPVRTPLGLRIREAFRPQKEGWRYVAADYSQIELRLLAHLSGDPALLAAFQNGEDIHTSTAAKVFNTPLDQVSKEERRRAKAINFGIIYGQQAYGLSQELGIDIREAATFIEAYFKQYPQVKSFIDQTIETTRKTGTSYTMIGREREIPEITSANTVLRNAAERLAVNTPLQGSAADLIKIAMLHVDKVLTQKKMQSFLILQIHDELIFEAPENEVESLKKIVKECMEGVFSLKVPLLVDVIVGKNWAEC